MTLTAKNNDNDPPTSIALTTASPSPLTHAAIGMKLVDLDLMIRTAIEKIDPTAPPDDMLQINEFIKVLKQHVREWDKASGEKFVKVLEHHGDVEVGTIRYYLAHDKTTKTRSNEAVMKALLEATGGDVGQICKCLASSAWKYGAIRRGLVEHHGEDYGAKKFDDLFETTVQDKTKEGKPKKKSVKVADTSWFSK